MNCICIFLSGGLGCVLRYAAGLALPSGAFPWATMCVNVAGSFMIGLFGAFASRFGWPEAMRLAATVGLCGGFTTFSTFGKETLALLEAGRFGAAGAYVASSLVLAVLAAAIGCWVGK